MTRYMSAKCQAEIKAFVRGGTPGLDRLRKVLPSVFRHYKVTSRREQAQILIQCRLFPVLDGERMTFEFNPCMLNTTQ